MARSMVDCIAALFAVTLVSLALGGCKVEEALEIAGDGSGTYRARIAVNSEFAEALSKIRAQGEQRGFRILDEGQRAGEHFLVIGREFTSVDALDDEEDSYDLEIEQTSLFRAVHRLTVVIGENVAASGFERTLRIEMPVPIMQASAGEVDGKTVVWDSSHGGTLVVEAAGFALPLSRREKWAVLGLAALLPVALVALRLRGRRGQRCGGCGRRLARGAKFCAACVGSA